MPFLSLGEELAKLDEPFHLGKAASEVSLKRAFVSNVAVGREFRETMLPGPALSGLHERSSDAAPPRTWFDVPAFYVGNRSGIAPIGERANRELEKSQGDGFLLCKKNRSDRRDLEAVQKCLRFFDELGLFGIRPKPSAKGSPRRTFAFLNRSYHHGKVSNRLRPCLFLVSGIA